MWLSRLFRVGWNQYPTTTTDTVQLLSFRRLLPPFIYSALFQSSLAGRYSMIVVLLYCLATRTAVVVYSARQFHWEAAFWRRRRRPFSVIQAPRNQFYHVLNVCRYIRRWLNYLPKRKKDEFLANSLVWRRWISTQIEMHERTARAAAAQHDRVFILIKTVIRTGLGNFVYCSWAKYK